MNTVEYIELFWDCPHCGHAHISAVFNPQGNRCPQCLHWRTEAILLYEAPDSQVITDATLINRKPFWVCKVCAAVHEDHGVAAPLLKCDNCDSYQTTETGELTGDESADRLGPATLPVGEPVAFQAEVSEATVSTQGSHKRRSPASLAWIVLGGLGILFLGSGLPGEMQTLTPTMNISKDVSLRPTPLQSPAAKINEDPSLRQVQVQDLWWITEVDVQQQSNAITQSGWQDSVPINAKQLGITLVKSERKLRSTRQHHQGYRTQWSDETYQSGTRTETYREPEQYQSGTRAETYTESIPYSITRTEPYTVSERYQSGTRPETYTESERYQSGTRQDCTTVTRGNGVGQRTCRDVPIYSTRSVQRTRPVPTYSTRSVQRFRTVTVPQRRLVSRTRQVPVYQTRMVTRTREVPVYSTRKVPVQEPILVDQPVYDTWVTYTVNQWVPTQTYKRLGKDDVPRQFPQPRLPSLPPHRIAAKRTVCHVKGQFSVDQGWLKPPLQELGQWVLPCEDYDRINIGDLVELQLQTSTQAKLVTILSAGQALAPAH